MKKIMFNTKLGLEQAVLEGRKTQTRRIVNMSNHDEEYLDTAFDYDFRESVIVDRYSKYKVGEIVAIAQSYHTIYDDFGLETMDMLVTKLKESKGWANKMFVKAELMPHQIRITNVRIERLQDISDENCLAEGIVKKWHAPAGKNYYYITNDEVYSTKDVYNTPREAFAALIDKVSGKGTWESNPYVFVYDFELVK